tara:strand:- start:37 stop:204 length:168 start_codon:yes stop_codon:yes gene_type:complete
LIIVNAHLYDFLDQATTFAFVPQARTASAPIKGFFLSNCPPQSFVVHVAQHQDLS